MVEKIMNVAITPCYGNEDKNSRRGKFNFYGRGLNPPSLDGISF